MDNFQPERQSATEPNTRYEELVALAASEFGRDALFTYLNRDEEYITMTFGEALRVCGQHIAGASDESIMGMLRGMSQRAVRLQELAAQRPDIKERYDQTLQRGKEALARRALAEVQE